MTANLATCVHYGNIKDPCKMEITRLDLGTCAYVPAKAARKIWTRSSTYTNPNTMSYSASPRGVANAILSHLHSLADLSYPNMRVMTHFSSMAPTGYPRIAPKSHAISARRHPQWATCNLRVESTPMGAAGRPLRRHRRRKSGIGGCSAGNHVMADTMDTLLTSRARRVAVQRPRAHPVPMKGLVPGDRPTSKKSTI